MKYSLAQFLKRSTGRSVRTTRELIVPLREWTTSIVVTLCVTGVLFTYAGLEFYQQYTDKRVPEVDEESIPRYRATDAEFLIRYHDGKEVIFHELREKAYPQPDVLRLRELERGSTLDEEHVAPEIEAVADVTPSE